MGFKAALFLLIFAPGILARPEDYDYEYNEVDDFEASKCSEFASIPDFPDLKFRYS